MADTKQKLREDLAMRNAAKHLVEQDIKNLRGDLDEKGVGSRFVSRMKEGAEGVVDESVAFTEQNPARVGSVFALGLGLLLTWFFREPIARFVDQISAKIAEDPMFKDLIGDFGEEDAEAGDAPSLSDETPNGDPQ